MVQHLLKAQRLLEKIRYVTRLTRSPRIQAFALCVVTVNNEHASLGVKFNDGIYLKFYLKLWFESDWCFSNVIESDSFESDCPETKSQTFTS